MDILAADGRLLARQRGGQVSLQGREHVRISVWGCSGWPVRVMDLYAQIGTPLRPG